MSPILTKLMNHRDLFKIEYCGVAYYSLPGAFEKTLRKLEEDGAISFFRLRVAMDMLFWRPNELGGGHYPTLFETFWAAYPPNRRVEKKECFIEWKALEDGEQLALPSCARAYAEEILISGTLKKYISHPKRFIGKRKFEDYAGAESRKELIEALRYWEECFRTSAGYTYPWTGDERDEASEDLERYGVAVWRDKVWVFFSGKDGEVTQALQKSYTSYSTFRRLLHGPLMKTRISSIKTCRFCSLKDGVHASDCPTKTAKLRDDLRKKEVEEGRAAGLSLMKNFKTNILGENDD